jgi:Glutathione S-transferase, N-terminal domain
MDMRKETIAQLPRRTRMSSRSVNSCHGDDGGPKIHPCRRVQEALTENGIAYEKVIAAHGNPIPFLRKGSREDLRAATGDTKLPTLKLADGTVHAGSKAIFGWIATQG